MPNVDKASRPLHQQIERLRWLALPAMLLLAALLQLVQVMVRPWLAPAYQPWLAVALYGLAGSVAVWLALGWLARNAARQTQTETELRAAYDSLAEIHRQLLAVHHIGRDIASAADIQQVLELAARAPGALAGALGSAVITFDEERDRLKLDMAWGLSDRHLGQLRRRVEAGIPAGRCRDCRALQTQVDSDCPLFQGVAEFARADGIRSLVCLPISRDQKREGIITAYFPRPDGPPAEQIQLLNIVATEIAAALDGVRLRAQQMASLYAVDNLTRVEPNLAGLLEQVLDISLAGWGVQRGALLLYDEAAGDWEAWAERGLTTGMNGTANGQWPAAFELAAWLGGEARRAGQPLLIPDLALYPGIETRWLDGVASAAAAPLATGGEHLGALVMLADQARRFQPRHASIYAAIAHQAALALNNARLHTQVQQLAMIEERYRLSREMHDGLAQTLGSLGWQLDHLKNLLEKKDVATLAEGLANSRQMVRDAYMDVREVIDGLRVTIDQPGQLAAALAEIVGDFEKRTGIPAQFQVEGEAYPLAPQAELQVLRIVQESLTNVRKHAVAQNVTVGLQMSPERLELTIADDGRGFDPQRVPGRHHLGLTSMRERTQSLGGSLTLATRPGQGTRLTLTLLASPRSQAWVEPAGVVEEKA